MRAKYQRTEAHAEAENAMGAQSLTAAALTAWQRSKLVEDFQRSQGLVSGGKGGLCRGDAAGAVLRCLRRSEDRLPQFWIPQESQGTPWPLTPAVKAGASDSSRVAAQSTSTRLRRVACAGGF